MRKKLGTRFPASRIKKIMQADEDVGKIALPVPILVSKALELFLQDLCDRTYEVTLQRGAKTVNCMHLKQCVKMYSSFDFLTDVVNKVPNLGGTEPCGGDERGISRRRKTSLQDGDTEASEVLRSAKMAMRSVNISSRGQGRGRGRGRGRPPSMRTMEMEKDNVAAYMKFEDDNDISPEHDKPHSGDHGGVENENVAQSSNPPAVAVETKREEPPAWPLPDDGAASLGIDPSSLVNLYMHIDEDEDYDNED